MNIGGRVGAGRVAVALAARIPDPTRTWDAAHALGAAILARHPQVHQCTVAVHGDRRKGLRWRLGRTATVSVHWAFTPHPDAVLAVLGGDPDAWDQLERTLPAAAAPAPNLAGEIHDLGRLVVPERARLPHAVPDPVVTWGRFAARAPRRVLRLGSCDLVEPPVIRIHPVLDHAAVPDWFVGFVLFHELLHLAFPPVVRGGRRIVHPAALIRAESDHPRYGEALAWERAQLRALLARCADRQTLGDRAAEAR